MFTPAFHSSIYVPFVDPFYRDQRRAADRTDGRRRIIVMVQEIILSRRFDGRERRPVHARRAVLSRPMYGHDPRFDVGRLGEREDIGRLCGVLGDFKRGAPRPDRADIDTRRVVETGRGSPQLDDLSMGQVEARALAEVCGRVGDVKYRVKVRMPFVRVRIESEFERSEPPIERAPHPGAPRKARP